jgi:hypothetical protein
MVMLNPSAPFRINSVKHLAFQRLGIRDDVYDRVSAWTEEDEEAGLNLWNVWNDWNPWNVLL